MDPSELATFERSHTKAETLELLVASLQCSIAGGRKVLAMLGRRLRLATQYALFGILLLVLLFAA